MHWETKNETSRGTGRFRLILQSAISGRDLQEAVNETGVGEGTAYAADDPRVFQISVQSANVDWSFTVEEAIFGSQAGENIALRHLWSANVPSCEILWVIGAAYREDWLRQAAYLSRSRTCRKAQP